MKKGSRKDKKRILNEIYLKEANIQIEKAYNDAVAYGEGIIRILPTGDVEHVPYKKGKT